MDNPFDAEQASKELIDGGWKQKKLGIWMAPWGSLYYGPAYAHKVMTAVRGNPICPNVDGYHPA
jgi:hypothetical protein